jgi:hypothetical protein
MKNDPPRTRPGATFADDEQPPAQAPAAEPRGTAMLPEDPPLPEITGYTPAGWGLGGCMGYAALGILGLVFWRQVEMSATQHALAWVALGVIVAGLYLCNTLDDDDVARSDRTS